MTAEEFRHISSICHKIDLLRGLVERDSIPLLPAIAHERYDKAYVIQEVYQISDEVTSNVKKILDRAGDEIKQYLERELKTLEDKFSKINVTDEDS